LTGLDLEIPDGIRFRQRHSTAEIAALLEVLDASTPFILEVIVVLARRCSIESRVCLLRAGAAPPQFTRFITSAENQWRVRGSCV